MYGVFLPDRKSSMAIMYLLIYIYTEPKWKLYTFKLRIANPISMYIVFHFASKK